MALAEEDSPLQKILAGNWSPQSLGTLARKMGVIKRARKKDLWLLLWTLMLGFSIGSKRTLTGLYQEYNEHAKETVSFSSFQGWLSEELAAFLKHLCIEAIGETQPTLKLHNHVLARFTELIAIDSTVLNLHRFLRKHFKSTAKTGAAAKLHVAINILSATMVLYLNLTLLGLN